MSKADIELLFGVQGGGSPSGKSAQNIKRQLDNIVNNLNKNPLGVAIELDKGHFKNFQQQISNLTNFAKSEAAKIQAAYEGIQFPQVSKEATTTKTNEPVLKRDTTAYYNAITRLEKLQTSIRENTRKWSTAEFGSSSKEYKDLVAQLTELENLKTRLESGSLKTKDFNNDLSKISSVAAESANAIHKNEENIRVIEKLKEGVKGYDQALISVNNKLVEVRKNVDAWSAASTGSTNGDYANLKSQIAALEDLQVKLKSGELTAEQFASKFSEIKRVVSSSAEAIKKAGKAFEDGADVKRYHSQLNKVNDLLVRVKKNLNDWSSSKIGSSSDSYRGLERTAQVLEEMRGELVSTGKELNDFDARFDQVSSSAKQFSTDIKLAGENTKSVAGQIKNLMNTLGVSFTFADAFRKAIEIGRKMVDIVTDVDTAMTELKKVTEETDATYANFLDNAKTRAHGLGATLADTVNATADFARLGNTIFDASSLADAAIVYKNVGDGIEDITTASESIISTMQAFGVEAKDAMSIVDSFNNVGNNFAISSKGIGDALLNSAASLHAAGNDIHESIALIAAANTTIQDPGKVGTALKTMSMYLRAAKTEAEEAGLSTENMASSVSELRDELLALTGGQVDIMLDVDAGKYKSTVEVLRDLSQVWDELSDTTKTNITELIGGGVRNANVISALMQNFSIVEDAMETSMESAGSALAENEKYVDSVAGKFAQLQSSFETLSTTILSSELVKLFLELADAATRFLTVISDVAFDNFFTTFSTLAAGGGIFTLFKDLD